MGVNLQQVAFIIIGMGEGNLQILTFKTLAQILLSLFLKLNNHSFSFKTNSRIPKTLKFKQKSAAQEALPLNSSKSY